MNALHRAGINNGVKKKAQGKYALDWLIILFLQLHRNTKMMA